MVVETKNSEKFKVRFFVVEEDLVTLLLGLNTTKKMKLLTVHNENFANVVDKSNNHLLLSYSDVFDGRSLGTLSGKVALQVDSNYKPVALPARKVPGSVREKL